MWEVTGDQWINIARPRSHGENNVNTGAYRAKENKNQILQGKGFEVLEDIMAEGLRQV